MCTCVCGKGAGDQLSLPSTPPPSLRQSSPQSPLCSPEVEVGEPRGALVQQAPRRVEEPRTTQVELLDLAGLQLRQGGAEGGEVLAVEGLEAGEEALRQPSVPPGLAQAVGPGRE